MLVLSTIELPNEEHVKHREPNTLAYLGNTNLGEGTLLISEDRFIWQTDNGQGISLTYPQISLHATSRDLNNFHSECLYLMFEQLETLGQSQDSEDNEDEDEDDEPSQELRFVPRDISKLDMLYQRLSECQLLHPDPQDEIEENDFVETNGQESDGSDNNEVEEKMDYDEGQFDDAH